MTKAEKARLMKHLEALVEQEGDFPGVLGNKNSFFVAKPSRRSTAKKKAVKKR